MSLLQKFWGKGYYSVVEFLDNYYDTNKAKAIVKEMDKISNKNKVDKIKD